LEFSTESKGGRVTKIAFMAIGEQTAWNRPFVKDVILEFLPKVSEDQIADILKKSARERASPSLMQAIPFEVDGATIRAATVDTDMSISIDLKDRDKPSN
jgi:hypothetical protein